jgi:TonB family protein
MGASLLAHCLLLAWLLHAPTPKFLAPSALALGEKGGSPTRLYWLADARLGGAEDASHVHAKNHPGAHSRLTWQPPSIEAASGPQAEPGAVENEDQTTASGAANPAPPAGTPYGTSAGGALSGDDVRPALPVTASDPVVDPADLPGGIEGSIVVEITIDATGNVVQKTVLKSLGPVIDQQVLAALEYWRFRPATRNGVAIPSKQDVYYHFRPRG